MSLRAVCPDCGAAFNLRDEASGRKIRCTKCQAIFVPGAEPLPPEEEPADEEPRVVRRRRRTDPAVPLPDEDAAEDRPRRRRRKPRTPFGVWSYLAFAGIVLAGLAVFTVAGILVYRYMIRPEVEEPVTAADRAVVLTAEAVAAQVPDLAIQPGLEKFHKARERLGSHVLRYEYGTPDAPQELMGKSGLYLQCLVTVAPRDSDAHSVYIKQSADNKLGPAWEAIKGIHPVDQGHVLHWGEDSSYLVYMRGISAVGHFFTARRGKRVIHVVLLGSAVHTADALRDLLSPILERLDNYNP